MRAYTDASASVTAAFPGAVMTIRERRNAATNRDPVTETGVVPGVASNYTVELDYGILASASLTVTLAGVEIDAFLPYAETPEANECAIDRDNGLLKFAASTEADALSVTYTPYGSSWLSSFEHFIQAELIAAQTRLSKLSLWKERCFIPDKPDATRVTLPGWGRIYIAAGPATLTCKRISVFSPYFGAASGTCAIRVTTNVVPSSGFVENTNGVTATALTAASGEAQYATTKATDWAVTVSTGVWLNVFCTVNDSEHQDIEVTLEFE